MFKLSNAIIPVALSTSLAIAGITNSAYALAAPSSAFKVSAIKVQGQSNIPSAVIEKNLGVKEGQTLYPSRYASVIQNLYDTGYFSDIDLSRDNNTLVVKVHERPTIASVKTDGNKKIKSEDLNKFLVQMGIATGDFYNPNTLAQLQSNLIGQYNLMGYYAARVNVKKEPLVRNRVAITIKVSEGLPARVKGISFVGNKAFSASALKGALPIKTSGFGHNFFGRNKYSEQKLNDSLTALSDYYTNRGYMNFHVKSSDVSLAYNHHDMYLHFSVFEGPKYTFSGYELVGDHLPKETWQSKHIHIKNKATFSRKAVVDGLNGIKDYLANRGYAFAMLNPVPKINEKEHSVKIVYYVHPGQKMMVNQISFSGNTQTTDNVLRQQLRYVEGSIYDLSKIKSSKNFVRREYPFITSIDHQVKPVPGKVDALDVDYKVTEQSRNQVSFQIGYSELDSAFVGVNLAIPSVFGSAKQFNIGTTLSKSSQSLNLSYTDPFFTINHVSQTLSAYSNRVNYDKRDLTNYATNSIGASVLYGVPISDTNTMNLGFGLDHTNLVKPGSSTSETVNQFTDTYGNNFNTYSLNWGISHNSTNLAYFPTSGSRFDLNTKLAVPGSSLRYYTLNTSYQWYHPVVGPTTIGLSGGVQYGNGYGNTNELPLYARFYGGGWGSVRGFSEGSMGPHDTLKDADGNETQGQVIGGNLNVHLSANFFFPPSLSKNPDSLRLGWFVDAGNIYSTKKEDYAYQSQDLPTHPGFGNMRYSTGLGLQWYSPVGMMAFSLSKVLNAKPGDDTSMFNFSIGQTF